MGISQGGVPGGAVGAGLPPASPLPGASGVPASLNPRDCGAAMFGGGMPPASPLTGRSQPQQSPAASRPQPNILTGNYGSPREPSYSQPGLTQGLPGDEQFNEGSAIPRTGSGRIVAGMI